jgi:Caspase domain
VNACLIRWDDDDPGVQQELRAVDNILTAYGFITSVFLIPKLKSHWVLMRKTLDFVQERDSDRNLFILYYAGHGRMNNARQAEWVFGQSPGSPFVDWSAIQGLFGTAKSDVLILLDTCAAASSATTSQFAVMETIAACGFERKAPPPGEHSMTNTLVDVLHDWINKPSFSAASLHTEILFRLKLKEKRKGREGIPLEWCVTPVHWINTRDCKAPGIEICRRRTIFSPAAGPSHSEEASTFVDAMDIDFDDTNHSSTPLSSISSTGNYKLPQVLITLQLEENQLLDSARCARWLDRFPLLAKWAKVEAVFPSYSTLMIISMPLPIWDMLPDHPACSFIGYVTGPNLGGQISPVDDIARAREEQFFTKGKGVIGQDISQDFTSPSIHTLYNPHPTKAPIHSRYQVSISRFFYSQELTLERRLKVP